MLKASKRIVDSIQLFSDKDQRHPDRQQELHMIPIKAVDIVFTVKSTIHYQFYLNNQGYPVLLTNDGLFWYQGCYLQVFCIIKGGWTLAQKPGQHSTEVIDRALC
jgi:hypothetical protein